MKKFLCVFLAVVYCFLLLCFNVGAVEEGKKYIETTGQINFEDLNIAILNDEKLLVDVTENKSIFKIFKSKTEEEKLLEYIEKYPSEEKNIINTIQSDEELVAIGYTETPLVIEDGHFERITADNSRSSITHTKQGAPALNYNFVLSTKVSRTSTVNSAGQYEYEVESHGIWNGNSWTGGAQYPDTGDDFIVQTVPNSMTIRSDSLRVLYPNPIPLDSTNYFGRYGQEYSRPYATSNIVKYSYKDDPLGINQVNEVTLFTTVDGTAKSSTRTIHTYYIHTWDEINISIEVAANTSKEVTLTLTPSIDNKSWPLCSSVAFNF